MSDEPKDDGPEITPETRDRLQAVRNGLLQLHKMMMDAEKNSYERANGPIASPHAFLQLLMYDPWFGWLRPVSELVVQIDELLDSRTPPGEAAGQATLREVRSLLNPVEEGEEFGVKYLKLMQTQPDVILKHGEIEKLL